MRTETTDVAIVGGGPSGSNAAKFIKEYNPELDVTLFERGEEPAANCAGGLGIPFLKHMGYKPPEDVVKSPIHEVIIGSPNEEITLSSDDISSDDVPWLDELDEIGWVVDRGAWDRFQLDLAKEEEADVRTRHSVTGISQNGSVKVEVTDRNRNEDLEVEAEYCVLANGPNWELAKQAGFDEDVVEPPKSELHMGLQYEFKDPEYFSNYGKDSIYLLFDRDYAPNGYTWSFAAGGDYTKWGAGVPLSHDFSVKEGLHKFLEDNDKMEMKENSTRKTTNAIIPTANPLNSCVNGRVVLVGDTAHHCDPLHGGGQMFGARASRELAKAISREDIDQYDRLWKDDFLDTLQNRFVLRDLIHNMDNSEYDRFIKAMQGFEVGGVNPDVEIPRMIWHIFRNDSGIFTKSAAEATKSVARQKLGLSI